MFRSGLSRSEGVARSSFAGATVFFGEPATAFRGLGPGASLVSPAVRLTEVNEPGPSAVTDTDPPAGRRRTPATTRTATHLCRGVR
jgi:hypothetical protein